MWADTLKYKLIKALVRLFRFSFLRESPFYLLITGLLAPIDVYVAGLFDHVGPGTPVQNFAKLSNGKWEQVPIQTGPLGALVSYGTTLYYSSLISLGVGSPLAIYAYDTAGKNVSFAYLPKNLKESSYIRTIYVDESFVLVGGQFIVTLKDQRPVSGGSFNSNHFALHFNEISF